jgi:EAL domain-containing protein (putative c-di-GMP-specific phosphodiesterase class I)
MASFGKGAKLTHDSVIAASVGQLEHGVVVPDPTLDQICSLAAHLLDHPMAAIVLSDYRAMVCEASHGLDLPTDPAALLGCIGKGLDPRSDELDAPGLTIRSCSAAQMELTDAACLLCVLDSVPRAPLSAEERSILDRLAATASAHLHMRGSREDADQAASSPLWSTDEAIRRMPGFGLLGDLSEALTRCDQLRLHYQPRIDLRSGCCIGAEALLRWQHPRLGAVPPGDFITLVERTSLMQRLTEWVLQTSFAQAAVWHRNGLKLKLSVNVSAVNLVEIGFMHRLEDLLRRHQLDPASIELEFTEGAIIQDSVLIRSRLQGIRSLGIDIAIDDFGTQYSNLSYLKLIPATLIKIDRMFVRGIATDRRDERIVRAITDLAHDLGLRVTAEGIEEQATYDRAASLACDEGQGFLMSRPLDPKTLAHWVGVYNYRQTLPCVATESA